MSRRSYRGLMHLSAWGLYDSDDTLLATVRAESAQAARDIFKEYGFEGYIVRRLPP